MFPIVARGVSHRRARWPRCASLLSLLALGTQLIAEPAAAFAHLSAPQESVQAVAAADQASYLPSSGRAEALAGVGKARTQSGTSSRFRIIEQRSQRSEPTFRILSRVDHPPRLLLRHRLRSSGADDLPG